LLKGVLVAGVASAVAFAIAPQFGSARQAAPQQHYVTIGPNWNVKVAGIDLFCHVFQADPDHVESGPVMFCTRNSASGQSRGVSISLYHIAVTDETGNNTVFSVDRSP
jgi:hypothetical protein